MSATITANNGAGTTSPLVVLGYETELPGRNIIHDLIGGGIAVALVAPRPRAGVLRMGYEVEADAWAALTLHAEKSAFTLTETDRPAVGMSYVLNGAARLILEDQTRNLWQIEVPYQEVIV
jgi:hypothetical protein